MRQVMSGPVRYLHVAHNEWSPAADWSASELLRGRSVREDQLDRDTVKRPFHGATVSAARTWA